MRHEVKNQTVSLFHPWMQQSVAIHNVDTNVRHQWDWHSLHSLSAAEFPVKVHSFLLTTPTCFILQKRCYLLDRMSNFQAHLFSLPPPKEVMFSLRSVCLSVCLSTPVSTLLRSQFSLDFDETLHRSLEPKKIRSSSLWVKIRPLLPQFFPNPNFHPITADG